MTHSIGETMRVQPTIRKVLIADPDARQFRRAARILAVRMGFPFEVETEHALFGGAAGDWLATNHPDDDESSDVWPISAERMAATYTDLGPEAAPEDEPSEPTTGWSPEYATATPDSVRGELRQERYPLEPAELLATAQAVGLLVSALVSLPPAFRERVALERAVVALLERIQS